MSSRAQDSRNPADDGTISGMLRLVLGKWLQGIDDMLPAIVLDYNNATNYAKVQPLISMVTTSNEQIQRSSVASVPVFQLGAGGFVLRFPVIVGDLGWIKSNDRDISLFKQSKIAAPPNTARKHDFADSVFLPDSMFRDVTIATEDAECAVLQSLDGTIRISLGSGRIKLTAPEIDFNTANANFSGNMTVLGTMIGGGINLDTHVHGGVQTGTGDTGTPI